VLGFSRARCRRRLATWGATAVDKVRTPEIPPSRSVERRLTRMPLANKQNMESRHSRSQKKTAGRMREAGGGPLVMELIQEAAAEKKKSSLALSSHM